MQSEHDFNKTLIEIYNALKNLDSRFISLHLSINRYNKILIKQEMLLQNELNKEELEQLLKEVKGLTFQAFKDAGGKNMFSDSIMLVTDVYITKEPVILTEQRTFYPEELRWQLPLPDHKLELLKKGVPVTETFTTIMPPKITSVNQNIRNASNTK